MLLDVVTVILTALLTAIFVFQLFLILQNISTCKLLLI